MKIFVRRDLTRCDVSTHYRFCRVNENAVSDFIEPCRVQMRFQRVQQAIFTANREVLMHRHRGLRGSSRVKIHIMIGRRALAVNEASAVSERPSAVSERPQR